MPFAKEVRSPSRAVSTVEYVVLCVSLAVACVSAYRGLGSDVKVAAEKVAECLGGGSCETGSSGGGDGDGDDAEPEPEVPALSDNARAMLEGMQRAERARLEGNEPRVLVASGDPRIGLGQAGVSVWNRHAQQVRFRVATDAIERRFGAHVRPGGGASPHGVVVVADQAELLRVERELDEEAMMANARTQLRRFDEERASGAISAEEHERRRLALLQGAADEDGLRELVRRALLEQQQREIGDGLLEGFYRDGTVYVLQQASEHLMRHEVIHARVHPAFNQWLADSGVPGGSQVAFNEALTEHFARQVTGTLLPDEGLYGTSPDRLREHLPALGGENAVRDCFFGGQCGAVDRALAARGQTRAGFLQTWESAPGTPPRPPTHAGHRH